MDPISSNLNQKVDQVSQFGDKFGPMVVKAVILLAIVLFLTKFLRRFFAMILTRFTQEGIRMAAPRMEILQGLKPKDPESNG